MALKGKSSRVLISMNDDFLEKIDQIAEKESRSRSELIRQALREYVRNRHPEGLGNEKSVEDE